MKDIAIKTMVDAGVPQAKAELHWRTVVAGLCDGDEPTEAGFLRLREEDLRRVLPTLAAEALIGWQAERRAVSAPEKPRRFKAGRPYTPAEYVAFYLEQPTNAELRETITRAVDGKPWLVAPDGKVREAESAQYIAWHMDEAVAPRVIMVDGVPVAPVQPGEEVPAKLNYLDPFTPGAFLDVNMGSARTGASFVGYSDEALSAMAFLYLRDVRWDGNLTLNRLATEMRGKTPEDILAAFPATLAAWRALKPEARPAAKAPATKVGAPVPFVSAGGDKAKLVYIVGAQKEPAAAARMKQGLRPWARRNEDRVVVVTDADIEPGARTEEVQADRLSRAMLVVFLVGPGTIAELDVDAICNGRRVVPVVVRACSWALDPALAGKIPLPRNGVPAGSDDNLWADVVLNVTRVADGLLGA